jgi:hypothetical protein
VTDQKGNIMFDMEILEGPGDIPKVFRTGQLTKNRTKSSLSELMDAVENDKDGNIND